MSTRFSVKGQKMVRGAIVVVVVVVVVVVERMFINVTYVQKCTSRSRYS